MREPLRPHERQGRRLANQSLTNGIGISHYRIRYDHVVVDDGKMSLRRAGRMHHLGIGTRHRGKRILALIDDTTVVIHLDTGEIHGTHDIDPDRNYWRNTQKAPGRWPRASNK